jgi:phosphatidylglycerol:prolipoprotein diacylglycerol transferase
MVDPVIFCVGNFCVRWYSIAYIIGIVAGWYLIKYFNKKVNLFNPKEIEDSAFCYIILGCILGGRFGYVVFYNPDYYVRHFLDIFKIWQGGMSFHGGMLGIIFSVYLLTKKYKIDFLRFLDFVSLSAPIGLFFGRIANFINQELYGRVTNSIFGVVFENAGNLPRHPSQLYEAFFEGAVLFALLFYMAKYKNALNKKGFLTGFAVAFYGIVRFFIEFFREPDEQIGYILKYFTMGQLLCVPMVIIGIFLLIKGEKLNFIDA